MKCSAASVQLYGITLQHPYNSTFNEMLCSIHTLATLCIMAQAANHTHNPSLFLHHVLFGNLLKGLWHIFGNLLNGLWVLLLLWHIVIRQHKMASEPA